MVIVGLLGWVVARTPAKKEPEIKVISEATPTPNEVKTEIKKTVVEGKEFEYYIYKSPNLEWILVDNFENKKNTYQMATENKCEWGINGGFYGEDNQPIGLFVNNDIGQTEVSQASWLNGMVGKIRGENNWKIWPREVVASRMEMGTELESGVQAGPYFDLRMTDYSKYNDKTGRRMVIAKAGEELWLGVIMAAENILDGPSLNQIPAIFRTKELQSEAKFEAVVNMDGGSAGAFLSPTDRVVEVQSVGSWICGRMAKD